MTAPTSRQFVGIVGALALLGALWAVALWPVNLSSLGLSGVRCGTALSPDMSQVERIYGEHQDVYYSMAGDPEFRDVVKKPVNHKADCHSALTTRRAWAIPLGITGAVVMVGAIVIRRPSEPAVE